MEVYRGREDDQISLFDLAVDDLCIVIDAASWMLPAPAAVPAGCHRCRIGINDLSGHLRTLSCPFEEHLQQFSGISLFPCRSEEHEYMHTRDYSRTAEVVHPQSAAGEGRTSSRQTHNC